MVIYTSYMGNWRNFDDKITVSVMASTPGYYKGKFFSLLAPPINLFQAYKYNIINKEQYFTSYRQYLESLDFNYIYRTLFNFSSGKDIVLLCVCKDETSCHRNVLAKYLSSHLNYTVQELPKGKKFL